MTAHDLAALVRHIREGCGLTPREFAERAGIGIQVVYKWEQGRGLVAPTKLLTALECLGKRIVVIEGTHIQNR